MDHCIVDQLTFQVYSTHHQITNNVVMNQSANVTIALGASPIMAASPEEQEDLSKVTGGLLINFGTIESLEGMMAAGMTLLTLSVKVVTFP